MRLSAYHKQSLQAYAEMLLLWNSKINLVSRSSVDDFWDRHIVDSIQISDHLQPFHFITDIGSGAGLPGVPLAVLCSDKKFALIESDSKKAAFLTHVIHNLKLSNVTIYNERIEKVVLPHVDCFTARAFAGLEKIFSLSERLASRETQYVLHKGDSAEKEVDDAKRSWTFDCTYYNSCTNEYAKILLVKNVRKKNTSS
jgi:16S rRNA (guanine527-N7)-methyltransferase